uniref:ATP-dependent DNA helicase n=1 Tax=Cyprinus carpio carpio TaxID=630221 RepID=A0A9J8ADG0_CYPCA
MPKLKRFRMRREPLNNKSKADVSNCDACVCPDVVGIVAANEVRLKSAEVTEEFEGVACSVVSVVKHKIHNVCTWQKSDIQDIRSEGSKLVNDMTSCKNKTESYGDCRFSQWFGGQYDIFSKTCKVSIEQSLNGEKNDLYEKLQEILFSYESCLVNIKGDTCAVVRHNDFYVVVDCNVRNACGLGSDIGTAVVVFNTNWQDLFLHIDNLMTSLNAGNFSICGINVNLMSSDTPRFVYKDTLGEKSVCTANETEEISASTLKLRESISSIRGSFHQGDRKFKWPGKQCVAISLAAIAMHSVHSVFSWESKDLDNVVNTGDSLYSSLRQSGSISDPTGKNLLSIQDLPKEYVLGTNAFKFAYADFVSGHVDVVDGDFIRSGACVTLADGLQTMFEKYDTCFFTLNGSTCAIIKENGKFAVVDSHARSSAGMVDGNGFSVVVYYNSLSCVLKHIENLSACTRRKLKIFEISGVCVLLKSQEKSGSHTENINDESEKTTCRGKKRIHDCINVSVEEEKEIVVTKKPRQFLKESTEILETISKNDANSDVVCLGNETNRIFNFSPLCTEVKHKLSTKLNIEFNSKNLVFPTNSRKMGHPCKTDCIVGDGNCFFRAVAQVICGTQKPHRAVRLAIVKHMELHSVQYKNLLRCQYASMEDYLTKSKMRFVGSWATELEIQAMANYLGVDIYTFHNEKWLKYSCMHERTCNQSIYLQHCNGNHYEVVICVKQPNSQMCYMLCQNEECNDGKRMRTRQQVKVQSEISVNHEEQDPVAESTKNDVSVNKRKYLKRYLLLKRVKNKIKDHTRQSVLEKYHCNAEFQKHVKNLKRKRYHSNALYKESLKQASKIKYAENQQHKCKVNEYNRVKYKNNEKYRSKMNEYNRVKYSENEQYKMRVKKYSRIKYQNNVQFKNRVKTFSKVKYHGNEKHRNTVKQRSNLKYHNSTLHKENVKRMNKMRREQLKKNQQVCDFVKKQFVDKVSSGPEFVCCVCHRLLFKQQVLCCRTENYNTNSAVSLMAKKCITKHFLHKCGDNCVIPCELTDSCKGKLWICFTCHSKVKKGEMPAESAVNNLELKPIPEELRCLNNLEQHLIALHIPFMKMLALPKGGQNGVHGPISCVAANIKHTTNVLPRTENEGSLICVKLKRKLTYKGHYKYQYVDTTNIKQALSCLKKINKYYTEIVFNDDWLNEFTRQDDDDDTNIMVETELENINGDEELHDRQQHCVFMDTCLQPVDIGQEVLDQYFDGILSLAPAEGNNPVKMLADETNEAKCFPVLFPSGTSTYCDKRAQRLTLSRYFNNRILHADGRFAQNIEYIFYAQYLSEIQQVLSNVSIALRKGNGCSKSIPSEMFKDSESLRQVLNFDEGYRFLKPIRGTPAFWQGVQKDLFAMVRQLGIPTWFCSFSSADMRWTNLMSSILKHEGRKKTLEQLEWDEKCELLRRNPVTAARMFDFRWHCFLKEVLMSPVQPIGEIVDYFYRVEFQQRGSPHVHCLFWIKNAPQIDKNSDEEVVKFIDKYVTCEVPCENDELQSVVTSVQCHSKRHSKTCKKKNTVCRFNFPKPPSMQTFICRRKVEDEKILSNEGDHQSESTNVNDDTLVEYARNIMTAVKKAVSEEQFNSLETLFHSVGINQELFEMAYKCINNSTHIVLKRQLNEVWVNQYNKFSLKCWNANMDIQYVTDAYACIVYIISYISKSEREMGLLLANAQRESATQGNVDARQALRKLGSVYLHNREVSAQEAVYRLTNMHLKECSRNVQFIPSGEDTVRMSLPLSVIQNKLESQELKSEEMWMTSFVDRYKNRPNQSIFEDMCLATFASEYCVVYKGQSCANKIRLGNNFGFIVKRTRTQPAVIRFARFSVTKNPEKFYLSVLQLFFPYRIDNQLKPDLYCNHEHFYKEGNVCFSDGSVHLVKNIVDTNRALFEKDADVLDNAQTAVDNEGILEDAWCSLCPEQQLERMECKQLRRETGQQGEEHESSIPDLATDDGPVSQMEKKDNCLSRSDGLSLIRSLNKTQISVFYKIRQWCLSKIRGKNPKPFHVFITGGAGTGKSHLIKAIQYEATRLLSQIALYPDDVSVVLTAPTGIAAFQLKASTIHHTFSIGTDVKLPYTHLGEEKLNSLRAKFHGLQILIIDEISMVDHKLLAYIHGRLRQIKQTGDFSPFGNVCVIAVGDFFQLPPVKGTPLYTEVPGLGLWSNCFTVVELTQVVRQKDSKFAELLNRLRKRSKKSPLSKEDLEMLRKCETDEDDNAPLHIFATNDEVHEHNLKQLLNICSEVETIEAEDFARSKKTGKVELIAGHHIKVYNTCLPAKLLLGINARVMLIKNIDVNDGLVNGVCGTVTHIVRADKNKLPKTIYIHFDDSH